MSKKLCITLAQLNLNVGDIQGNLDKLITAAEKARDDFKSNIIVFPELSFTGYPPEDLLLRKSFIKADHDALHAFIKAVKNIHCVVGHLHSTPEGLQNACSLVYNGTILGRYAKQHLPNYGVFDEGRYFIPGNTPYVIPINGIPVGLVICEDLWFPGPVQQAANQGARIILAPNASPFEIYKPEARELTCKKIAMANEVAIVYVNCVGGQDELVFDGGSIVMNTEGDICQNAGYYEEALLPVEFEVNSTETIIKQSKPITLPLEQRIYNALVLGVKDYVEKNNFKSVLVGVSGGIDSALTLAIAIDALGKDRVYTAILPSRYTSAMSMEDANKLVKNFDVKHETISIEPAFEAFLTMLKPSFKNKEADLTEENLQARCRGVIMMALSNKFGHLVLTTGNRSETAVGYTTLYGDMAGGLDVLKDVSKTEVYKLAHYRNQISKDIPDRIISRAPSAELAHNQTDQDSLPPYDVLDTILALYLNQEFSEDEIIERGFDRDMVLKIIKLVNKSEYKRRQAPIGIRVNHKAFGKDRRYPITHK